jgi:hypothetical protein
LPFDYLIDVSNFRLMSEQTILGSVLPKNLIHPSEPEPSDAQIGNYRTWQLTQSFNGFGYFCRAKGPAKITNCVSPKLSPNASYSSYKLWAKRSQGYGDQQRKEMTQGWLSAHLMRKAGGRGDFWRSGARLL